MAQKHDIQYVGQFYIHGSEAKELAAKQQQNKAKTILPLERIRNIQKIYVDPVALFGIAVAVFMAITMVLGAVNIRNAWNEYETMQSYLTDLKEENARLSLEYSDGYDLAEIEAAAITLGLVPREEVTSIPVRVTVPVPEEEPTAWEEFKDYTQWFIDGLFA